MPPSVQPTFGPLPLQRLDEGRNGGETSVQKVDRGPLPDDLPLEMAKAQLGKALALTIARTDSPLKDFGDPSQVRRVCAGDVPAILARAWQREDTRREFVKAMAEVSGQFDTYTHISEKRKAAR